MYEELKTSKHSARLGHPERIRRPFNEDRKGRTAISQKGQTLESKCNPMPSPAEVQKHCSYRGGERGQVPPLPLPDKL